MRTFIQEQAEAEQQAEDVISELHPLSYKSAHSSQDERFSEQGVSVQDIRGALQNIEDLDGFLIPHNLLDEHRELHSLLNLSKLLQQLSDPSFTLQFGAQLEKEELLKVLIDQPLAVSSARPEFTAEGVTFDGICRIQSTNNIEIISLEPLQLSGELYVEKGYLINEDSPLPGETSIKGITLTFTTARASIRSIREDDQSQLAQAA